MNNLKNKAMVLCIATLFSVTKAETTNSSSSIELNSKSFSSGTVIANTPQGKDVIGLAATNGGVTHDYYNNFNVSQNGLTIYNNTASTGSSAIINEVVGTSVSNINGLIEIKGAKADFYLINPNGINVNNGGVIGDVNRAIFSTRPSYTKEFFRNTGEFAYLTLTGTPSGDITLSGNVQGVNVFASRYITISQGASVSDVSLMLPTLGLVNSGSITTDKLVIKGFNATFINNPMASITAKKNVYFITKNIDFSGTVNAANAYFGSLSKPYSVIKTSKKVSIRDTATINVVNDFKVTSSN